MKAQSTATIATLSVAAFFTIAFVGYSAYTHRNQRSVDFAGCDVSGRFDQIVSEEFGSGKGTLVQGWVIDPTGTAALRLDGVKETYPIKPLEERKDVRATFPKCSAALTSGFSVRLPATIRTANIALTTTTDGGIQVLDQKTYVGAQVRFDIDSLADIEPNGTNILSGWAISTDGAPVHLELVAQDRIIATAVSDRPRTDAAAVFPTVPGAGNSGFEAKVSYANLPRGEYKLKVRAQLPGQPNSIVEREGPVVRNRHVFGLALSLKKREKNPKELVVSVWIAHESGIKDVHLFENSEGNLGQLTRRQAQAPFGSWSRELIRDLVPPMKVGSIWTIKRPNNLSEGVHRLLVVVETSDGVKSTIPAQVIANESPQLRSRLARSVCERDPLVVFYPTGPGTIAELGAQREVTSLRDLVEGPCVRVGMRLRVEYLRTTLGKDSDFAFDPNFRSTQVKVNGRSMTTAGLDEALRLARKHSMPVLISFDGGVWADSAFAAPDWDVVDNLENDEQAVQWNQNGRSEKDDAFGQLMGVPNAPQLGRMMSLNFYNSRFRAYKKRNLQSAVSHIVATQAKWPNQLVWINFDSDNYINPWFKNLQWYDYNTDTIRQFREWLTGSGPYASAGPLAMQSIKPSLQLDAINKLAKKNWTSITEVDAPRDALDLKDPWHLLWVKFKRHLVAQHYSDLSEWACQAGMVPGHIYTAVGISDGSIAQEFDDPIRGWNDQSGVSLRGGKPSCGHLGVVMYGPATRNESPTFDGKPLMDSIARIDPGFGVVEFHPANLDIPNQLPTAEASRKSLNTLRDAGMKFLSPMWGSISSGQTLFPAQFNAHEAMEGTDFETELIRMLRALNDTRSRLR